MKKQSALFIAVCIVGGFCQPLSVRSQAPAYSKPSPSMSALPAVEQRHILKGFSYARQQRFEQAAAQFDQCEHLDHLSDGEIVAIIKAYTEADEQAKMLPLAKKLVERQAKSKTPVSAELRGDAFYCRAACYAMNNMFEPAAADYKQAGLLDKSAGNHWLDYAGQNYCKAKKYDLALDCFTKSIERAPGNPLAHFHKGVCYDDMGKWADGLLSLDKAIFLCLEQRKHEPEGYAFVTLGAYKERIRCLEKLGKHARAAEDRKTLATMNAGWNDTMFGGK